MSSWQITDIGHTLLPSSPRPPFALIKVAQGDGEEESFLAGHYLSQTEQLQFSSYRFSKRRREWLAGRIAVKQAANQLLAQDSSWPDLAIRATEQGQPLLARQDDEQPLHISISHSADQACGLACHHPCGVDLQQQTEALPRVKERFVAPKEDRVLAQLPISPLSALALLWAAKESLRKSIPLWPLLGFLESEVRAAHHDQDQFTLHFQASGQARHLPCPLPPVQARLSGDYALAVNFVV